jgi:hypothetical protein
MQDSHTLYCVLASDVETANKQSCACYSHLPISPEVECAKGNIYSRQELLETELQFGKLQKDIVCPMFIH